MFTEDTVMISLWFVWSADLGFWYRKVAMLCLIPLHFHALMVQYIQCYVYNGHKSPCDGNGTFYHPVFY